MKIHYNPKHDLLHIILKDVSKVRNQRVNDEMVLDIDKKGKVVGIEILDASSYLGKQELFSVTVEQEKDFA